LILGNIKLANIDNTRFNERFI